MVPGKVLNAVFLFIDAQGLSGGHRRVGAIACGCPYVVMVPGKALTVPLSAFFLVLDLTILKIGVLVWAKYNSPGGNFAHRH
jgi:hypothetical protein